MAWMGGECLFIYWRIGVALDAPPIDDQSIDQPTDGSAITFESTALGTALDRSGRWVDYRYYMNKKMKKKKMMMMMMTIDSLCRCC